MKKIIVILSMAIAVSLVYACTLNSDSRASTTKVNFEITGPLNEKSLGSKSLINDPAVLSVIVSAENSSGTVLNTAKLTQVTPGTSSWTGSMTINVTGQVTFKAKGWSGLDGTGSVLYYGISEVEVTPSDQTHKVSIGTVLLSMNWTKITTLAADQFYCNAIASSADGQTLALIGSSLDVYSRYISTDSGASWPAFNNLDYYTDIAISADGTHIAAVTENNGQIHISTDSGTSWDYYTIDGVTGYTHIKISDNPKKFVAMGFSYSKAQDAWMPKLCTSTDLGANWNVSDVDVRESWNSDSYIKGLTISTDGTKVAFADSIDYIYTSTDSGESWVPHNVGQDIYFMGIAGSADGTKLVAVAGGSYSSSNIYTSADAGMTWISCPAAGVRTWVSIASSADGTKLAAAAYMDYIYTSADAGETWTAQEDAGIRAWTLNGITCSADGTKLAAFNEVGSDGLGNMTYSSVYIAGY